MTVNKCFFLRGVRVEPDRLRLSSHLAEIEVQPRVMDVIVALAADAGAVVSRQELLERVWGPTQVGYHALARAVHQARKALAVVAPGEPFIDTIPQRGYRLCASEETPTISAAATVWNPAGALGMRIAVTLASIAALGLVMHAIDLHGSRVHLVSAALILATAVAASLVDTPINRLFPAIFPKQVR